MESEELLPGNVAGAVRVGDTVRRPTGPWTPAVHALLGHLATRIPRIPRVLGFDDLGREILDFLPGRVIDTGTEQLTLGQIVSVVAWTSKFHNAVAGFTHSGPWRYFPIPSPTLIGHNDIAPYNVCFAGDDLLGVFDWDMAGPSTPLSELAFIAWNCVPLWRDTGPDPAAQRLATIAATYGAFTARQILHAVPPRIQIMLDGIPAAAAAGDRGMATSWPAANLTSPAQPSPNSSNAFPESTSHSTHDLDPAGRAGARPVRRGRHRAGRAADRPAGRRRGVRHGGHRGRSASFEPLFEQTADLNLTVIDLPGHGLSDPIRSATCNDLDYVAVILELAHEQGWDRFHLVGHSFGGGLATLIAGLHPEKVSRLVLIDTIGPLPATAEQTRTTAARYLHAYLNGKGNPTYRTRDQAINARVQLADILFTTAATLVERDLSPVPGGYTWNHDPRLKYPAIRTFTEEQVLACIRAITAPTLVITADRSGLVEDFYPGRIAAVPDLRRVTLPGGHHLHMENTAPVAALIRQFLAEP